MKKHFFTFILLFVACFAFAQPKGKQKEKEKPPTQKEMDEMMKEMQKSMDEMSPEDKKAMDSMGVKMPDVKSIQKNVSGISDAQLKKAFEDENRIVPEKDAVRIATISKTPLSVSTIIPYLRSVHEQLLKRLEPAAIETSEKIYQWLKTKNSSVAATGNAGAGLWIIGSPEHALYILSKACMDGSGDADNLNNFAACLSMAGGEEMALPVLSYLNKQYPQNSTILNNIGEAWFGLGDMDKATKYLDSALSLCPSHPQATLIKSLVEESKGNITKAVELVEKSIQKNYSQQKEDRLKKMGHKLTGDNIDWPFPHKPDILGLEQFKYPDFPKSVDESIALEPIWKDFEASCTAEMAVLKNKLKQAEETMQKVTEKKFNENLSVINSSLQQGAITGNITMMPFYGPKASLKLKEISEGKDGYLFRLQKSMEGVVNYNVTAAPLAKAYNQAIDELNEKEEAQSGEGKANLDFCPKKKDVADHFLSAYNTPLQPIWNEYLRLVRTRINEETYWYQYMQWPEQFEVTKLSLQIEWLRTLSDIGFESMTAYKCLPVKTPKSPVKLANFNDIHCVYHSELNLGAASIKSDCDKMETKIDISVKGFGLKGKLNQDFGDNKRTFADQFVNCTIELGYKEGVGFGKGPLRAEAKAGAYGFVEIDRNGFADGGVKLVADVKLGTNILKPMDGTEMVIDKNGVPINLGEGPIKDISTSVIGAEVKLSIMSGPSVEGRGILKVFNKTKK